MSEEELRVHISNIQKNCESCVERTLKSIDSLGSKMDQLIAADQKQNLDIQRLQLDKRWIVSLVTAGTSAVASISTLIFILIRYGTL